LLKKRLTQPDSSVAPRPWPYRILALALAGALLLWAAFPPLDFWPLAWIAPVPWLLLVRQAKLTGWKPYLQIWLAGFVHWLLMLQGVRLAHPALVGGWFALSAYLAIYLVLFVAISRVAVQQLRWPLWVAAPLVWIGMELLRGHLISGFASGLLAHTQTAWPLILQLADLGGGYFVSGLMILVAAALTQLIPGRWLGFATGAEEPLPHWAYGSWLPSVAAAVALAGTIGYGAWRLHQGLPPDERPPLQVALIQGSLDTRFDQDPNERFNETFSHYAKLTLEAVQEKQPLDLIVWPESMFAMVELQAKNEEIPEAAREQFTESQKPFRNMVQQALGSMPGSSFLFGTTTFVFDLHSSRGWPDDNYNTALLVAADGKTAGRYYKMHAVMFGEYIPCGDLFPFLYRLTPMPAGLSTGIEPVAMELKGYSLAPNICFESTVPQLIREQVATLERTRRKPLDVIVNVSNDGWFKGSAILDLHFRGSILRAIENRKPVIIAANTGISAHVDGCGRVLTRGPKRAPQVLLASVTADGRASPYHLLGDVPAWLCAWISWSLAVYGVWRGGRPPGLPVT
jgi:apolipoprotein N-acyltransferase